VERLLDRLEGADYLRARRLDNGGSVLDLTAKGRAALGHPEALEGLLTPPTTPAPKPAQPTGQRSAKVDDRAVKVDEELYEKLRAWRLVQAREQNVSPYVVFHDSHLRAIAAHRPVTLEALGELKGVGPKRLEQYGAQVVALVRVHLGRSGGEG
jgi:superfamily II DNA helicase RecQ